jgi:hexosaminidase
VEREMLRYDKLDINYAKSSFRISNKVKIDLDNNRFSVVLSSELPQIEVRYTLDGSEPTIESSLYTEPIIVDNNVVIKTAAFQNNQMISPVFEKSLEIYKSTGKKVILKKPPAEKYSGLDEFTLTNSIRGSVNYADKQWLGFEEINIDAVVDLGKPMLIKQLSSSYLNDINSWIFLPRKVVYFISPDGENFKPVTERISKYPENYSEKTIVEFKAEIEAQEARYIRVFAENVGICPDWHMGAGDKAWIFIDEIIID